MMWDVGVSEVMSAPTLVNAPLSSLSVEVNLDLCETRSLGNITCFRLPKVETNVSRIIRIENLLIYY